MNLPGQVTLRSSGGKCGSYLWSPGPALGVELGLDGVHALLLQVARGLAIASGPGAVVRGAAEHLLAVEGLLDSFFLHARAPDAVGHAAGPHALALGRRLGAEVVEALHGLRHPWLVEGEVARETVRVSPQRR